MANVRIGKVTFKPGGAEAFAGLERDRVARDYSLAWPTPMLWGLFGGAGSSTGVPVTPLSALQASAVYACVDRISKDIACLPKIVQRFEEGHGWVPDFEHPFNRVLMRPNNWMTPFEFWRYMEMAVDLRGNAIAVIKRGWNGDPEQLIPINWDRVSVLLSPKGILFYNVSHPQIGWGETFHQDDVIHIRNLTVDGGYLGMTPISVAQDVVGMAIAAQQHGAVLFRQGAQLAKVLTHPGKLSDEAAQRIATAFSNAYGGVQNAHKTAVLEEGMTLNTIGMTNEDAQFLELRGFQTVEICRMFDVPPPKIHHFAETASYSSLEQLDQAYATGSIKPRCQNISDAVTSKVFSGDELGFTRFWPDYSEMLQGDMKSQAEYYGSVVNNGLMNRNEGRSKLGMGQVPGGDTFRIPANTQELDASGKRVPMPAKAGDKGPGGLGSDVMADKGTGNANPPLDTEIADQAVM